MSTPFSVDLERHPALAQFVASQLDVWPEHEKFLTKRLSTADLAAAERIAALILRLAGEHLAQVCQDYRWTCERLLEEEIHFRRTGRYRVSSAVEAEREVYGNREFMGRYMNGLLLSQLWWSNHTSVIDHYASVFLPANREGYRHLEIGPGHGLLLYFAAQDPRCGHVAGWDVSQSSVDSTRAALLRLGVNRPAALELRNVLDVPGGVERFDSIVISEVCEHVETPEVALRNLRRALQPAGRIYVNMPVNSPAPDHIYLLRKPEEVVDLVRTAGYEVEETRFFPVTGYSEERARRAAVTISCVVVGRPIV